MIIGIALALTMLQACSHSAEKKATEATKETTKEKQSFFPVTDYIKGQIKEISVNPMKYVTINDHTDSALLKIEDMPEAFNEFLHPEIDSLNMVTLFKESGFMDQTIDAFTFTYEPIRALPDSMALQHWDVYIDPETKKVRRIYMVKNAGPDKTIQLTWQGDKWCKISYIANKPDGTSVVEKEIKIIWKFE